MPRTPARWPAALAAAAVYIATIAGANWLTSHYGQVWVLPGLTATAGTYAAGAALGARDELQDTTGRLAVVAAIVTGGALSWWLSTPALALASGAAFLLGEGADMAVYTPLRRRGWARAVLVSNTVGAALDTLLFLVLAQATLRTFDPAFTIAGSIPGQLVGKLLWATLIPVLLIQGVRRAVPRNALRPSRA